LDEKQQFVMDMDEPAAFTAFAVTARCRQRLAVI